MKTNKIPHYPDELLIAKGIGASRLVSKGVARRQLALDGAHRSSHPFGGELGKAWENYAGLGAGGGSVRAFTSD